MAIKEVFVMGAGAMGNGIAQVSAEAGYEVTMMDIKEEFIVKTITEADVMRFAEEFGDFSLVDISSDCAKKTLLGGKIAHGMPVVGLISVAVARLLGQEKPLKG